MLKKRYTLFHWRIQKMSKEKTCKVCGRIITDEKNKTGLCPKHQKEGINILGGVGIGAGALHIGLKKCGPKIASAAIKIIKK